MPSSGFGTATLHGEVCESAVFEAIKAGVRCIDTALLYNNQAAVGAGIRKAIAAGLATREELFVTTKVAFYPADFTSASAGWVPIAWHAENLKGEAAAAAGVDLCLQLLGLDYVDLLLIHNPCTALDDYTASSYPHCFELGGSRLTAEERALVLAHRFSRVRLDAAAAEAARAASWRALEAAQAARKARFIGVSNFSVPLIRAMAAYARVMPAVNQLELHARFASPALRAYARESGLVLTAYGSGNSVRIDARLGRDGVLSRLAAARGCSSTALVLRWTLQVGVAVIPRTATVEHIKENLSAASLPPLSDAEMAEIAALNEDHPFYCASAGSRMCAAAAATAAAAAVETVARRAALRFALTLTRPPPRPPPHLLAGSPVPLLPIGTYVPDL